MSPVACDVCGTLSRRTITLPEDDGRTTTLCAGCVRTLREEAERVGQAEDAAAIGGER